MARDRGNCSVQNARLGYERIIMQTIPLAAHDTMMARMTRIIKWLIIGWTRQKIALETGYSVRQISRKLAKLHDIM